MGYKIYVYFSSMFTIPHMRYGLLKSMNNIKNINAFDLWNSMERMRSIVLRMYFTGFLVINLKVMVFRKVTMEVVFSIVYFKLYKD